MEDVVVRRWEQYSERKATLAESDRVHGNLLSFAVRLLSEGALCEYIDADPRPSPFSLAILRQTIHRR
jgi:hypothetical protein